MVHTCPQAAKADPELAALSAMAHGQNPDTHRSIRIAFAAIAASTGLDAERSTLYFDLVLASLSEAARKTLQAMDPAKYEYQSEFAKRYFSEGRAEGRVEGRVEGRAEGRAEIVLKLLALRFGSVSEAVQARVKEASAEELERFAERVLSAKTIEEVLG